MISSFEATLEQTKTMVSVLEKAGFTVTYDKPIVMPHNVIEFLGVHRLVINLVIKSLSPSVNNVLSCKAKVKDFLSRDACDLKLF